MQEEKSVTPMDHNVLHVIKERRSIRSFSAKAVESDKIDALFEAARWAPSSMNEQPWRYVYATKDQLGLWNKIFDALSEGNRIWVKHAPLLIASFTKKTFTRNDRPNGYAAYDLGAANGFLSLQATALGLQVHQMGGYDAVKLKELLNVPDEYQPGAIMAVGYPDDPDKLPEDLKVRERAPRKRHDQDEFVLNSTF